ncbi:MAG: hypothetical protein ACI4VH_00320 [Clostridia bacterium]
MYYVQETDKPNALCKLFNIVKLQKDKIILPIGKEEVKSKRAEKLAEKTKKILDKTNCNKLVLSKIIKTQQIYKNYLYSYNLDIVEGRWLFEALSMQALEYVINKERMKKEETQLSILVNEITDNFLETIKEMVKQYKSVNIVTNHIEKFKRIEEKILQEDGIMITVTNNKKKSLAKSKIILNVDFPTELINQYYIYEEAIIINLRGNVKINRKRYNGININDYKIDFNYLEEFDYDKDNLYDKKDIYEAQIYQKQPYKEIKKRIKKDRVEIVELIGNKTVL